MVWFRFTFKENGADMDLRGTYSFTNVNEQITINNEDVEADDVVISNRIVGVQVRGVIEFQFQYQGKTHRYRFDATLVSLI